MRAMSPAASVKAKSDADDATLFARVAAGDAQALRALYDRYASRALAIALRILGGRPESEEVVQETFLELWRRARDFDRQRGAAAAWIAAMARNRAIDRLRSRGVYARHQSELADEPVRPSATPLEDVEQRIARESIGAALAELPVEQRRSIELAYFEGLTQREIAERTGEPLGTIKTRMRLGLEKLANLLGGLGR
jgi:RNA polymerase sigma-70 factor (ECF subfamily)